MAKLCLGYKPGVGSVVKVMANPNDDFRSVPNTAYGKFRFNSETADVGMIPFLDRFAVDLANYPAAGGNGALYPFPRGTTLGNCKMLVWASVSASGALYNWWKIYLWNRILGVNFPPLAEAASLAGGTLAERIFYAYDDTQPQNGGEWISRAPGLDVFQTSGGNFIVANVSVVSNGFYSGFYSWVGASGQAALVARVPPKLVAGWALPANSAALPFAAAKARKAGTLSAYISPDQVRIARPGYDVRSASKWQLMVSEDQSPARVMKTGQVNLGAGRTASVNCGVTLPGAPNQIKVDAVVAESGAGVSVFPAHLVRNIDVRTQTVNVTYSISGSTVTFVNHSSFAVTLTYVIYADDTRAATSGGGGQVIFSGGGYSQIRRAGSKKAYTFRDVLIDTRWASLPIVKQAWLPLAAFGGVAYPESRLYGSRKAHVVWTNDGTWRPLIKYAVMFNPVGLASYRWSPPTVIERNVPAPRTFHSRGSSVCRFTDNSADFYLSPGEADHYAKARLGSDVVARWQDINNKVGSSEPVGIRYYIFAIPKAL